MEPEIQEKIEKTVREILGGCNMDDTTEYKIRKMASERLEMDLSQPKCKSLVRKVVEAFLAEQEGGEAGADDDDGGEGKSGDGKEYDDAGDLILCRLSDKRRVTLQDFRGKTLVSIREFYRKDGKELPTSKGISLTSEQWLAFKKNISAIDKAVKKMEARLR